MTNHRKHLLLSVLLFYFIFLSCNSNPSHGPDPADVISGIVVDSLTGLAIDSAEVIFGDTLVSTLFSYTDTTGSYNIALGLKGVVDVYCRKENYITKKKTLDLPYNNLVINYFNFELTK